METKCELFMQGRSGVLTASGSIHPQARSRSAVMPAGHCHCRLLVGRLRHARFDEAHVPSIGVASIDHDDAAVLFAKIAIRARHSDGELGKAVPAIALDMRFDDFDRMAPGTGGEAAGLI